MKRIFFDMRFKRSNLVLGRGLLVVGIVSLLVPFTTEAFFGSFEDVFDGVSINTVRYATKIQGNGTIAQNNAIVMAGDANNEIIWNILYTNDDLDFSRNFTITVDVDLAGSPPIVGDSMAIVGIEERSSISLGKKPKGAFCEVSIGNHGIILRGEDVSQFSIPSMNPSVTVGKVVVSYTAASRTFSCNFGDKTISTVQAIPTGQYALTLRSGIHAIVLVDRPWYRRFAKHLLSYLLASGGGGGHGGGGGGGGGPQGTAVESPGIGSFKATFDNLKVTTATPAPSSPITNVPSSSMSSSPTTPILAQPSSMGSVPMPAVSPSSLSSLTVGTSTVVLKSSPTPSTNAKQRFTKDLSLGMRGEEVKTLQRLLIAFGFLPMGNDSGFFGRATQEAVKKFQKMHRLSPTGVFGSQSRKKAEGF